MKTVVNLEALNALRARAFRLPPHPPLTSARQALKFVNERGFVYFWPISGADLPSLWVAAAGDRPVADRHDDPGHVTWRWKDDALGKRQWYYAKILRGKATMISLALAPYFYALSDNYGSPEEDYLFAYREGRLSQAARQIYEALIRNGALNTLDLRKAAKLSNAKDSEFAKALTDLQRDFKILPVGVARAGAWKYSHVYEIAARHFPNLPEEARKISESQARAKILSSYFEMVGAARPADLVKLFGWGLALTGRTLDALTQSGTLIPAAHPKFAGEWLALPAVAGKKDEEVFE